MSEKKQTPYQYDEEQAHAEADSITPGAQECAMAHALLMIAEQLRVANLIALSNAPDGASESTNTGNEALFNPTDTAFGRSYHGLKPDIAAILGLRDDHE